MSKKKKEEPEIKGKLSLESVIILYEPENGQTRTITLDPSFFLITGDSEETLTKYAIKLLEHRIQQLEQVWNPNNKLKWR